MGIIQEFKKFAMRGNVVDMAVGIIIGASFNKIVSSMVADVIMPPIGVAVGGVSFGNLAVTLKPALGEAAAVTLNYGKFIQSVFDFGIVAVAVFLLVKGMNALARKKEEQPAPPAEPPADVQLLGEIRDLLKQGAAR